MLHEKLRLMLHVMPTKCAGMVSLLLLDLSQAGGRDCLNVEGRTVEHLRACTGVQFAVAVSCQIASLIGVS